MRVVHQPGDLKGTEGGAFVPTMGALHEGHVALMRQARGLGKGPLVISIFVNPTQFGPGEDYRRYPHDLEADLAAARAAGVDIAFVPDVATVYPPDEPVPVPPLPDVATRPGLEDRHRRGHFAGVCQVVARLFDLARPSVALFGEKDYQQLLVICALVAGSPGRWPGLRIEPHPTVREPGGLALSSRNRLLGAGERGRALGLHEALRAAQAQRSAGRPPGAAQGAMERVLAGHVLAVDYAVVRDAATLLEVGSFDRPARALVAARLGDVRLIDNSTLG